MIGVISVGNCVLRDYHHHHHHHEASEPVDPITFSRTEGILIVRFSEAMNFVLADQRDRGFSTF